MTQSQQAQRPQQTGVQNDRPTIGLLVNLFFQGYTSAVWSGVLDGIREQDVNLICFAGGTLHSPHESDRHRNVLFDLAGEQNVDGVLVAAPVFHFVDGDEQARFLERYRSLPLVTIAHSISGIPRVIVDNETGMRELFVHLIEIHGYRRLAFIRGPAGNYDADSRYHIYTEALADYGIPLDPALVVSGDFRYASGKTAIQVLLDHRQVDVEVVVASNDEMAFGALEAIRARGIRVPADIALTGFDGREESQWVSPPLTTVRQPLRELGKRAVELLLAQITGTPVPEQVVLPAKMVVRRPCGCISPAVARAGRRQAAAAGAVFETGASARRERIVAEIIREIGGSAEDGERVRHVLEACAAEISGGTPGIFLCVLDDMLGQIAAHSGDIAAWQRALSILRRHLLDGLDAVTAARFEDLWQQARVLVGEVMQRVQAYQAIPAEQQAQILRDIGQTLITTFRVETLMDVLAEHLPRLDIPSAYVALYEDPQRPTDQARLMLAYDETGRIELEAGGQRFASRRLLPEGLLSRERRRHIVVEALHFHDKQIGFALFEGNIRKGKLYDTVAGQISSALQGALLVQQQQALYAEAQAARQAAEIANQVKSTFLANMSHELRTPLNAILGFAQIMARNQQIPVEDQENLSIIRHSGEHLLSLINNVLDLSKIEAGRTTLNEKSFDLYRLLDDLEDMFSLKADDKHL